MGRTLFDNGNFQSKLAGADRADVSARPCTDDNEIVTLHQEEIQISEEQAFVPRKRAATQKPTSAIPVAFAVSDPAKR